MKRLWWISLLLQSVLGVVPVIRYKVTDGTKEDSYIGNIGMVTLDPRRAKTALVSTRWFRGKLAFLMKILIFSLKYAIFEIKYADFGLKIPFLVQNLPFLISNRPNSV